MNSVLDHIEHFIDEWAQLQDSTPDKLHIADLFQ